MPLERHQIPTWPVIEKSSSGSSLRDFNLVTNPKKTGGLQQVSPNPIPRIDLGHYARSAISTRTGQVVLLRSKDPAKDQTFFLSQISQQALSRTLFPLANWTKQELRGHASSYLPRQIAQKPDSQGLCFVSPSKSVRPVPRPQGSQGRHFSDFLREYLPAPEPATVTLEDGQVVGTHSGIFHVTIGERARLNFGGSQKLKPGAKWYVASKSTSPPSYTIVPGGNHPMLYSKALVATDWRWIDKQDDKDYLGGVVAQIRHRQVPIECTLERRGDGNVRVEFEDEKGVYGVTPGQAVAVYLKDRCLGGGIIDRAD
jgi:tRNA-specific 2-thiouridylase